VNNWKLFVEKEGDCVENLFELHVL